jgi:GTPase SAR1 family protein
MAHIASSSSFSPSSSLIHRLKYVYVGLSSSGSSSYINRICYNQFDPSIQPTNSVQINNLILTGQGNNIISIELWDVPHHLGLGCSAPSSALLAEYFNNISILFIVCSSTDLKSFQEIPKWKEKLSSTLSPAKAATIPVVILCTKSDSSNSLISPEQLRVAQNQYNVDNSYLVSAAHDINCTDSLHHSIKLIKEKQVDAILQTIQDQQNKNKAKSNSNNNNDSSSNAVQ